MKRIKLILRVIDILFRFRSACAGRLLRLAGRGRGLWPWLPAYLLLLDTESWLKKRMLLMVIRVGGSDEN